MAKQTASKSEQIREHLAANPEASAPEVAKALKVSTGLVYNVKSGMKQSGGKKRRRPRKRRKAVRVSRNGAVRAGRTEEPIVHAARLIKACGSVEEAERVLRAVGVVATTLA
jgi:hypothetical protein